MFLTNWIVSVPGIKDEYINCRTWEDVCKARIGYEREGAKPVVFYNHKDYGWLDINEDVSDIKDAA